MNIFALHDDPVIAAQFQCDKHVVKMPTETAQMLSMAVHDLEDDRGRAVHRNLVSSGLICKYTKSYASHPCTLWAKSSPHNLVWLYEHGIALISAYDARYGSRHGREHASGAKIVNVRDAFPHRFVGDALQHTPFVQCMPDKYKSDDAVESYRSFYRGEKAKFAKWNFSAKPEWW